MSKIDAMPLSKGRSGFDAFNATTDGLRKLVWLGLIAALGACTLQEQDPDGTTTRPLGITKSSESINGVEIIDGSDTTTSITVE